MHEAPQPELSPREQLIALHQIGFTEEAIAYGLQVSQSTISRLMRGLTNPKYVTAKMIAEFFERYRTP
ncbi:MAG: helix-turn-helix transcriptional regulator [Gammaproteobacteria bacterium]